MRIEAAGPECGLAGSLGLEAVAGLSDVLQSGASWKSAIMSTWHPQIALLGRGTESLVWNDRLPELFRDLSRNFDVLLIAAGLLLRSYANVLRVPPGFNPDHLLMAETVLPPSKYRTAAARSTFYDGVLQRIRALPSVSAAGYVNFPPLTMKGRLHFAQRWS